MRAAYLLSPSFITRRRIGASKATLILIGHYSHFLYREKMMTPRKVMSRTRETKYPDDLTKVIQCLKGLTVRSSTISAATAKMPGMVHSQTVA